ncbi:MAG: NotI family restriction endonuclease [Ferruginibacter sp.]
MSLDKKDLQPLGEVFGFPIDNKSDRAKRYRDNKLCPYNNIVSNCTKNSIEFYISGNLTGPFTAYLENPTPDFSWTQAFKYPKPDHLSSSRKRLIPQLIAKGSILKQWNKK